jgi:V8-like Glu-specific endopeptidase
MADPPDPFIVERLALERARLESELELKRRELELKAAEQARSRWSNPLVIAAATGVLGLLGNFFLSQYTAQQQLALEREKRQGELLVKAISTDDKDAARRNLAFLIDIGLLSDEGNRISSAIKDPNRVPVLPSGTGRPVRELPASDIRRAWAMAVGRLDLGGQAVCTAVLVAPDLILTASYCFAQASKADRAVSVTFNYLGAESEPAPYAVQRNAVELVQGEQSIQLTGLDYALLRVEAPRASAGPPLRPLPIAATAPKLGEVLAMVSHLGGGAATIVDDPDCKVREVGPDRFEHTCFSRGGSGGGPLLRSDGQVVGIEFAGDTTHRRNVAIRIDRILEASSALRAALNP